MKTDHPVILLSDRDNRQDYFIMIRCMQPINKDLPRERYGTKTFRIFISQKPKAYYDKPKGWKIVRKKLDDKYLDRDWYELRRWKSRPLEWYSETEAEACVDYLLWNDPWVEKAVKYFY